VTIRFNLESALINTIGQTVNSRFSELHYMYYNFDRIHQTLRVTPAMEAGLPIMFGAWRKSSPCYIPAMIEIIIEIKELDEGSRKAMNVALKSKKNDPTALEEGMKDRIFPAVKDLLLNSGAMGDRAG